MRMRSAASRHRVLVLASCSALSSLIFAAMATAIPPSGWAARCSFSLAIAAGIFATPPVSSASICVAAAANPDGQPLPRPAVPVPPLPDPAADMYPVPAASRVAPPAGACNPAAAGIAPGADAAGDPAPPPDDVPAAPPWSPPPVLPDIPVPEDAGVPLPARRDSDP
ncbi:MAG: hypothetical protein N3A38_06805, partial [Planctomycetota bacterium]|nr:hypothetical protein [Planctomycetota bacterium]